MAVRHYKLDYSINSGPWIQGIADEAAGPSKSLTIGGLGNGTYAVRLRITPLTGDPTPVVSDELIMQVGSPSISESPQSIAQSVVTLADVVALKDQLIAAVSVAATASSALSAQDQGSATASAQVTSTDTQLMAAALLAAVNGSASVADVQQSAEQLIAAVSVAATVADSQSGVVLDSVGSDVAVMTTAVDTVQIAEQLVTSIGNQTTVGEVLQLAEQLVAAAAVVASQADNISKAEPVQTSATTTATIADVQIMLQSVLAAATVAVSQADGAVRRDAATAAADVVASVIDTKVGPQAYAEPVQATADVVPSVTDYKVTPQTLTFDGAANLDVEAYSAVFTKSVVGGGTAKLDGAGNLLINGPNGSTDAALVYRTNAITYAMPWVYKVRIKTNTALIADGAGGSALQLVHASSKQAPLASGGDNPISTVEWLISNNAGTLNIWPRYFDASGLVRELDFSTGIWSDPGSGAESFLASSDNSYLWFYIYTTPTGWSVRLRNGADSADVIAKTAEIAWVDTKTPSGGEFMWVRMGDKYSYAWQFGMYVDTYVEG